MQAISLYWFAALRKTSSFRQQKIWLFYLQFSAEFNDLSLYFQRQQEMAKK